MSEPVRPELIEHIERLREIQTEWEVLLLKSRSNDLFLSPRWLLPWWETFGREQHLFFLALWKKAELVGLFPLKKKSGWFNVISFVGLPHSDRMDFLLKEGLEKQCLQVFHDWIVSRSDWDMIFLRAFGPFSGFPDRLAELFENTPLKCTHSADSVYPYIRISEFNDFEDYLKKTRNRNKRKELRRLRNKLTKETGAEWVTHDTVTSEMFDEMEDINCRRSTRGEKGDGFFGNPRNKFFLKEVVKDVQADQMVTFFGCKIDGDHYSYLLCFEYCNKLYPYVTGFDRKYLKYSIGTHTILEAIKHCFDTMYSEFDFLEGDEEYKFHWTGQVRQGRRVHVFNKGIKSRALFVLFTRILPVLKGFKENAAAENRLIRGLARVYRSFIS